MRKTKINKEMTPIQPENPIDNAYMETGNPDKKMMAKDLLLDKYQYLWDLKHSNQSEVILAMEEFAQIQTASLREELEAVKKKLKITTDYYETLCKEFEQTRNCLDVIATDLVELEDLIRTDHPMTACSLIKNIREKYKALNK